MHTRVAAVAAALVLAWSPSAVRPAQGEPAHPPPAPATSPSFLRDVVPVLTKAGCNAGACHGSFQGRGGLRLSLLGFDPQADYLALVEQGRGRRVFPAAPDASLMLLKPTATVPHGGGRRLERDSESYRILHDWIADGLAGPDVDDAEPVVLQLGESELAMQPGETARLSVTAIEGRHASRDVTRWALYEARDDRVASVSAAGDVAAVAPGRTAVTVRYRGQVAAVIVTVPYAAGQPQPNWAGENFIDHHIAADWQRLGLAPAPLANDAAFLRRVSLDLIGTLPTPQQVDSFLASGDPAKRSKLIDALLQRPEYVDYWTLHWSDLLRAHRRYLGDKGLASFRGWLQSALRENHPLDEMVCELLTAQGNLYTSGPVAFYFVDKTPQELAETTAQVLLGVRLQCAHCHHHPFEVWSQEDYYGLAAFFARVERKDTKEEGQFGGLQAIRLEAGRTLTHPDSGEPVVPKLLGGAEVPVDPASDERRALADWITGPDNPLFARNVVNRYWGWLFGRGLVEPIDDLRATNPASNGPLLDALAADFVAHGYDLKHLLRTICNARVYQLDSEVAPQRDADGTFFTHRVPRRLPAEVLLDAVDQACLTHERFQNLPADQRAIALPDPTVPSTLLDTFGRPKRSTTCLCERGSRFDLTQALLLVNSQALHEKITSSEGRLAKLVAADKPDAEILRELYLATLSRPPRQEEIAAALPLVAATGSRREGLEDVLWALLNSAEFTFNH